MGMSVVYSSVRSTLTIMVSVVVKLEMRPESRFVTDSAYESARPTSPERTKAYARMLMAGKELGSRKDKEKTTQKKREKPTL